jgi:hypothetical protein
MGERQSQANRPQSVLKRISLILGRKNFSIVLG